MNHFFKPSHHLSKIKIDYEKRNVFRLGNSLLMRYVKRIKKTGFSLIELLVVIGVIGILITVVLVAVNPGRQFALARDTQRRSDIQQVINACYQFAASNNGNFPQTILDADTTPTDTGIDGLNLVDDLVPDYIYAIPYDPITGSDQVTGYQIYIESGRIKGGAVYEVSTPPEPSPTPGGSPPASPFF